MCIVLYLINLHSIVLLSHTIIHWVSIYCVAGVRNFGTVDTQLLLVVHKQPSLKIPAHFESFSLLFFFPFLHYALQNCIVLYFTLMYGAVLYFGILNCTALTGMALYCTVLCSTVLYYLYFTEPHCTALHCAGLHLTILYCFALNSTVL